MLISTIPHVQLHQAFCGLKQAQQAWFDKLRKFLLQLGFILVLLIQAFLFIIYLHSVLLLYVDEMVVMGDNSNNFQSKNTLAIFIIFLALECTG